LRLPRRFLCQKPQKIPRNDIFLEVALSFEFLVFSFL